MSVYILSLIMKPSTRLIKFFSIVIVAWGALGFFVQNRLDDVAKQEQLETNFGDEYGENKYSMHKWDFKHWEEKYIKKYNIQCNKGTHIDSFYHDPSWKDMIPMEEFYTLDIYCVDENNVKNWIFYKFAWEDFILQKWYFLNWEMDWERYLGMYDEVTHYKNWKRDWIETWYHTDWSLRYTWAYVDGKNEWQWTFYFENWNISTIRVYSGGDMIKRREFYEDGKIKYECIDGWACISYDENWKITRKTPNNYRTYSWDEFRTYPNWQLEKVVNYVDGKLDGKYAEYYENGQVSYVCNYTEWKEERCISYDENWEVKHETWYYKWMGCSKEVYDDWMWKSFGSWLYTWYYENGQVSYICNYASWMEEWRCAHYKRDWKVEEEYWYHEWKIINQSMYEEILKQEQDKLARKNIVEVSTWKWVLTYNSKANISYIDTEWYEFNGIWTITYSDQEWNSITMLDRNLWATKSWTWEDSYWYYFWWWNNYWFKNGWDISNKWKPNWYSRNNPYISRDTNLEGTYNNGHRNLWWWTDDNEENLRHPNVDNWYMRQWPCPAWYHVPSVWERTKLINIWFKHEHWMDIKYIDWMFYNYYWDLVDDFTRDFKLPYAWSRVDDLWKRWQYRWSSLSKEPYNFAYELVLYPKKEVDIKTWSVAYTMGLWWWSLWWWAKLSVRCFKDEYRSPSSIITLKYETNWWTKIQSQTLLKWSVWFLPWYTTHKTWFELEWWYLDPKFTKKYDFSIKLNSDTTIYAKREKSKDNKNNWMVMLN